MLRFLDIANALTLVSLVSAVTCALLAMAGHIAWAVIALILSGLCDLFDGFVARRLPRSDERRQFGGNLDTVVDSCAFGFAPVVLLYSSGLKSAAEAVLLAFFSACAVWRLAYFETVTVNQESRRQYFEGMPTTYVALFLPVVYLVALLNHNWLRMGLVGMTLFLACAMVSTRKVRKPSGIAYAVFLTVGVVAIAVLLFAGNVYDSAVQH